MARKQKYWSFWSNLTDPVVFFTYDHYLFFTSFLQFTDPDNIAPSSSDSLSATFLDLPTIDVETFKVDRWSQCHHAKITHSSAVEEVIRSCVTPRKVQSVQEALQKEEDRHRCAMRLLPYFFSKEELSNSNIDGTHGKQMSR